MSVVDRTFRAKRQEFQWHTLASGEEFALPGARGALYERLRRQVDPVWLLDDWGGHLGVALNGAGVECHSAMASREATKFAQGHAGGRYKDRVHAAVNDLQILHAGAVVVFDPVDPAKTLGEHLQYLKDDAQLIAVFPGVGADAWDQARLSGLAEQLEASTGGRWPFEGMHTGDEVVLVIRKTAIQHRVAVVFGIEGEAHMATEIMRDGRIKSGYFNWGRMLHAEAVRARPDTPWEDYEYILCQIAGTNYDAPRQIRERLGPRSNTKLIVWCDYALEYWHKYPPYPDQLLFQLNQADYICAVEPVQQRALASLLSRPVELMPHPTDIQAIRRCARPLSERSGALVLAHRDGQDHLPAWMLKGAGLKTHLLGVQNPLLSPNGSETGYQAMLYDRVEPQYLGGEQAIDLMSRHRLAIDAYTQHVCGRSTQELATLGVPTLGGPTVEAQGRCFPDLTFAPGDVAAGRQLVRRLLDDEAFFQDCTARALAAVQHYDYPRAQMRFDEMIDHDPRSQLSAPVTASGPRVDDEVEPGESSLGDLAEVVESGAPDANGSAHYDHPERGSLVSAAGPAHPGDPQTGG